MLQFSDTTARADWLRVLQREAKVELCDLFITVPKSDELHASGEYEEIIQFERQPQQQRPVFQMYSDVGIYEEKGTHCLSTFKLSCLQYPSIIFKPLV